MNLKRVQAMYTYIESLSSLSFPSLDPFLLILLHPRTLRLTSTLNFTSAVVSTNFCRGVQTFAVVFSDFFCGVHKLLPWQLQTFSMLTKSFLHQFQNKVSYLKRKGLNLSKC